jgi:hypothetical protein
MFCTAVPVTLWFEFWPPSGKNQRAGGPLKSGMGHIALVVRRAAYGNRNRVNYRVAFTDGACFAWILARSSRFSWLAVPPLSVDLCFTERTAWRR